jgi:hypothetical protein
MFPRRNLATARRKAEVHDGSRNRISQPHLASAWLQGCLLRRGGMRLLPLTHSGIASRPGLLPSWGLKRPSHLTAARQPLASTRIRNKITTADPPSFRHWIPPGTMHPGLILFLEWDLQPDSVRSIWEGMRRVPAHQRLAPGIAHWIDCDSHANDGRPTTGSPACIRRACSTATGFTRAACR